MNWKNGKLNMRAEKSVRKITMCLRQRYSLPVKLSQELHGLRYVYFLGDGDIDSKTQSNLKNSDLPMYENVLTEKVRMLWPCAKTNGTSVGQQNSRTKNNDFCT